MTGTYICLGSDPRERLFFICIPVKFDTDLLSDYPTSGTELNHQNIYNTERAS